MSTLSDTINRGFYQQWKWPNILSKQYTYKDGKIDGSYTEWKNDGCVVECEYNNGIRNGRYMEWKNLTIIKQCTYRNGQLHGVYRVKCYKDNTEKVYVYENGERHGLYQKFYDNGVLMEECMYVHNKKHGPYNEWSKKGILIVQCIYQDDKRNGLYRKWDYDGNLTKQCTYKNNKLHGSFQKFKYGILTRQSTYIDGKLNGICLYIRNFEIFENTYLNDKLNGISRKCNIYGQILIESQFINNELIKVIHLYDKYGNDNVLPEGEIMVWKACCSNNRMVYCKLKVPVDAKRITCDNTLFYKSRVQYAYVDQIIDAIDGRQYNEAQSFVYNSDKPFVYRVGEMVVPDGFEENPALDCGKGINVHLHQYHCDQWSKYLSYKNN